MKNLIYFVFSLVLFSFSFCNNKDIKSEIIQFNKPTEKDSIIQKSLTIHYYVDTLNNKNKLDSFNSTFSIEEKKIIAAINRLDVNRIKNGTILSIPDTILPDFNQYCNFPIYLPITDSIDKIILISLRTQLFAAYENGKLVRYGPTSTGKKSTPSPSGLFYTNYKSRLKISTVNGQWKMPWYFNISNKGGIGLHQYTLPGYPASHSCIRLYEADAIWIFDWAKLWILSEDGSLIIEHGTPVIVFGKYNFIEPAPWRQLSENTKALDITDEEWSEIKIHLTQIIK